MDLKLIAAAVLIRVDWKHFPNKQDLGLKLRISNISHIKFNLSRFVWQLPYSGDINFLPELFMTIGVLVHGIKTRSFVECD